LSSHYNLYSVSRTIADRIWNGIKDDKHIRTIITSEGQIIHDLPNDNQNSTAQISVYLFNITEMPSMRNQPRQTQNSPKPQPLIYLNLRYIITPLTYNAENNQVILGKIMQIFAEKPILRGSDLQGTLRENGDDLRIILDDMAIDNLAKLWNVLSMPYRLSASYSVFPVPIEASIKPQKDSEIIIPAKDLKSKNQSITKEPKNKLPNSIS
jgi:hypothetical protein